VLTIDQGIVDRGGSMMDQPALRYRGYMPVMKLKVDEYVISGRNSLIPVKFNLRAAEPTERIITLRITSERLTSECINTERITS
jgi:hypothetical protein